MRAAAAALLLGLLPATVASAETCGEHVVRPGETLSAIARAAPGAPSVQQVYEANRDRLPGPDHIEVGQSLRLPCPPGAEAPDARPESEAPAEPDAAVAPGAPEPDTPDPDLASERPAPPRGIPASPPDPEAGPIRLAWGGDVAGLPAGERARVRLKEALAQGAPGRKVEIEAAPGEALARIDPGGGIGAKLVGAKAEGAEADGAKADGAEADLAFAWIAPDCTVLPRLDLASAELCVRYVFSDPLAVAETAWFVRADDAARGAADLAGARICRPEGRPIGDIAALGLAPPRARLLRPATAADCLRLLGAGEAEAAALFVEDAPAVGPGLRRLDGLGGPQALVALAHPANPRGLAALAALNRGLAALPEAEAAAPDAASQQ